MKDEILAVIKMAILRDYEPVDQLDDWSPASIDLLGNSIARNGFQDVGEDYFEVFCDYLLLFDLDDICVGMFDKEIVDVESAYKDSDDSISFCLGEAFEGRKITSLVITNSGQLVVGTENGERVEAPKTAPLFISNDGVEIFPGDTWYAVHLKDGINYAKDVRTYKGRIVVANDPSLYTSDDTGKYIERFSTLQLAKEKVVKLQLEGTGCVVLPDSAMFRHLLKVTDFQINSTIGNKVVE